MIGLVYGLSFFLSGHSISPQFSGNSRQSRTHEGAEPPPSLHIPYTVYTSHTLCLLRIRYLPNVARGFHSPDICRMYLVQLSAAFQYLSAAARTLHRIISLLAYI
jgi:hypothetical protein